MTSSFDDSVLNFDLGFLNQTSKNTGVSKLDKQRKAILLAKQKTITTDGLIRKYYNKKELLEQTERTLFASKEECKQICIDYKNVLEKCERLENEIQVVHHYNQQLQQKLSDAENQCCGIQSHAKQLEVLVKEQETQIESLKIENHLEKTNTKSFATSTSNVQKQNDILLQDLCTLGKLLLGNKKLKQQHGAILEKYKQYFKQDDDSCNDSGGGNSDSEMDLFEDNLMSPQSPLCVENNEQKAQSSSVEVQEVIVVNLSSAEKDETSRRNEIDGCSVCSTDLASADTGRGSSLAFSDSEKCFRSPDYLSSDNHNGSEFIRKPVSVNSVGTSPIRDTIDIATSPIHFEPQTVPTFTFDKAISPLKSTDTVNVPTTPSKECPSRVMVDHLIQNNPDNKSQFSSLQVEKCLQVNSNNNYEDEYSRDGEIEMILSKMQFHSDLITPMPSSPCSSHSTAVSRGSGCQTNHSDFIVCEDAAKLKEDNKILHANIADLAKEIMNIKSLLKMDPTASSEKNTYQEKISKMAEISKSNTTCENNNIEQQLKNHNEKDDENVNENDDLIDMVDLVQICNSEDMSFSDLCNLDAQEDVQNNDGIFNSAIQNSDEDIPIIIIEEQGNAAEGIMSRLEFEKDPSPMKSTPDKLTDINSKVSNETPEQNPVDNSCNYNEKVRRRRKLNHLEKLRRKMIPKCKIRREKAQSTAKRFIKKRICKPVRQIKLNTAKNKATLTDSSASLNDKTVYDNAVKIMSELKEKQSEESVNKSLSPKQTDKSLDSSEMKTTSSTSAKRRLFDISKLALDTTEKPFDISDLIAKQTPRPVVKSVSLPNENNIDKIQNIQSLKNIQPIVCIDKLLDKTERKIDKKCIIDNSKDQQPLSPTAIYSLKNIQPIVCIDKLLDKTERQIDKTQNIENSKGQEPLSPTVTTRSRSRFVEKLQNVHNELSASENNQEIEEAFPKESRKRLKRVASDEKQEIEHKRILRSSMRHSICENINTNLNNNITMNVINIHNEKSYLKSPKSQNSKHETNNNNNNGKAMKKMEYNSAISYDDLDMFDEREPKRRNTIDKAEHKDPKDSILCNMLDKYSLSKIKFYPKKNPDEITNAIYKLIEESIQQINELHTKEPKSAMGLLIENLQSWNAKQVLSGLMKYLQDPERKVEMYSKINSPPAPPMTKSEQILIYVIMKLRNVWSNVDFLTYVLSSIEYTMFKLNRSPEFDTVESMSHFYAVLCRYFKLKTRLRLFMLDAMYCMQYKAIALIRQCMDVWMHILPLAHMGIAKNPLVTCVVYLLHFYKCEDHFNRVQDIRNILNRKYSYQMSEWNETKILEMFRNAIYELRDNSIEKKMIRLSLIILAKRQGARWCQKNIITNMLQPIIENKDTPHIVKEFCVSMIGPLVKPFPVDMKVHCEIVINQLLDMRKLNPSPAMEEAIFTSLMFMCKHNQNRVVSALLSWYPKSLSSECQEVMRDFVREKPANTWKGILTRIYNAETLNSMEDQ